MILRRVNTLIKPAIAAGFFSTYYNIYIFFFVFNMRNSNKNFYLKTLRCRAVLQIAKKFRSADQSPYLNMVPGRTKLVSLFNTLVLRVSQLTTIREV